MTKTDLSRSQARSLLAFYAEAGVDCMLRAEPVNRLEEIEEPQPLRAAEPLPVTSPRTAGARTALPPAAVPGEPQMRDARERAATAADLDALRAALEGFDGCNLKTTARNLVFGSGNPSADVAFIGEAPGRDEDASGEPFVGRSGRLLDAMLSAIGLDRKDVWISNVIPWRPPGNRTPTPMETELCRPFIERQIGLIDPKILVLMGGSSAKTLLRTTEGILRLRGKWQEYRPTGGDGPTIRTMATLHPAYLLRQPLQKRLAWRDFLAIQQALSGSG